VRKTEERKCKTVSDLEPPPTGDLILCCVPVDIIYHLLIYFTILSILFLKMAALVIRNTVDIFAVIRNVSIVCRASLSLRLFSVVHLFNFYFHVLLLLLVSPSLYFFHKCRVYLFVDLFLIFHFCLN